MLSKPVNAHPNNGVNINANEENKFYTFIEGSSSIVTAYKISIYDSSTFEKVYETNKINLTQNLYAGEELSINVPLDSGMTNGNSYYWVLRLYQDLSDIFVTNTTILDAEKTLIRIRWHNNVESEMYISYKNETRKIISYTKESSGNTGLIVIDSPFSENLFIIPTIQNTQWDDVAYEMASVDVLPQGRCGVLSWSNDGKYLATNIGYGISPFIAIYELIGGTTLKSISVSSELLSGIYEVNALAWSPDGKYLVIGYTTSPYVTICSFDGISLNKIYNHNIISTSHVGTIEWSPDGKYLAIGTNASPYFYIYEFNGGIFTRKTITSPSFPQGTLYVDTTKWSNDGKFFVIGYRTNPFISIYKISSGVFTLLPTPSSKPTGFVFDASWSKDNKYLAVGHQNSPGITVYSINGDIFTKLTNPDVIPSTNVVSGVSWDTSGEYLAVAHNTSPFISIYKFNDNRLTKLLNSTLIPTGIAHKISFSPNGLFLAVGSEARPFLLVYTIAYSTESLRPKATICSNFIDSIQFPFYARGGIQLNIVNVPNIITSRKHEFIMEYYQPEFVPIKWHRFVLYDYLGNVVEDTGKRYSSNLTYSFNGFIAHQTYYIEGYVENINGIAKNTVRYKFDVIYDAPGLVIPRAATVYYPDDAVKIEWGRNIFSKGIADGDYHFEEDYPFKGTNSLVIDSGNVVFDNINNIPLDIEDIFTLLTDVTLTENSYGKIIELEDTIEQKFYYVVIKGGKIYSVKDSIETFLINVLREEKSGQQPINIAEEEVSYIWDDDDILDDSYYWIETLPFMKRYKITMLPNNVVIREVI